MCIQGFPACEEGFKLTVIPPSPGQCCRQYSCDEIEILPDCNLVDCDDTPLECKPGYAAALRAPAAGECCASWECEPVEKPSCGPCMLPPCAAPPDNCDYAPAEEDSCGCPVGCGELKCRVDCSVVDCMPEPRCGPGETLRKAEEQGQDMCCPMLVCEMARTQQGCAVWNDGCNDCRLDDEGKFSMCTTKLCLRMGEPYCVLPKAQVGVHVLGT